MSDAQKVHPKPVFYIGLAGSSDGGNIDYVQKRLISLSVTEESGTEADQFDLLLDNSENRIDIPPRGAILYIAFGWENDTIYPKGLFIVDEVEHSGAPDRLSIRGRSADLRSSLSEKREQSWHDTTLGEIVRTIAARNELAPDIDAGLDSVKVSHIDQTGESDINFVDRLAKRFDATATVKWSRLVFDKNGGDAPKSLLTREVLKRVVLTRQSGDQHRFSISDREAYTSVQAHWHDSGKGAKQSVTVPNEKDQADSGKSQMFQTEASGEKVKTLRHVFSSQASAENAARADWKRIERGIAQFSISLALGRPDLEALTPVTVQGFHPQIDGEDWIIKRLSHRLGDSGLTTSLELEIKTEPAAIEDEPATR